MNLPQKVLVCYPEYTHFVRCKLREKSLTHCKIKDSSVISLFRNEPNKLFKIDSFIIIIYRINFGYFMYFKKKLLFGQLYLVIPVLHLTENSFYGNNYLK